ncbi:hypothetical protein ACXX84_02255 [Mycoplasma sp. AC157]
MQINIKEKLRSLKNFSITNLILTFSGLILFIITLAFAAGAAATQSAEGALAAGVGLVGSILIVGILNFFSNIVILVLSIVGFVAALKIKDATNGSNKKYFAVWLSVMIIIIINSIFSFIPFVGSILGMIFSIWPIVAYILTIVWANKDAKALN